MSNPNRRTVLTGVAAAVTVIATPALALSTNEARALINEVVARINDVINSGKSESAMYRDFEALFNRYADVPTISRSALGPPARSASAQQLKQFADAFAGYLARKYGKQFRDFIGGEITVESARQLKSFQEVQAVAKLRGQSPFNVTFMVSDRSGSDRFFDLLIEGISLLKSERAEVGAMLDKRGGDIDTLIRDLKSAG
mgnify:FL=1